MGIEHILQRHTNATPPPVESPPGNDVDIVENFGGCGILRGQRDRCVSLELRKRDDTVLAIQYALIEQILYSPADGITLRAAGREIRIRGRGLNEASADRSLTLFAAMARHRVLWVAEKSRVNGPDNPCATTAIESIMW